MRIACISAANTRLRDDKSTSVAVCTMIKEMIEDENSTEASVEIIPLRDYDFKSCILCGQCSRSGLCAYDSEFNRLLNTITDVQIVFLVVPHYSPIPSKLLMIFEKINEITYAGWLNDPTYQPPFQDIPVGIIGHGGMVEQEESLRYYHDRLVTPIADTLRALGFRVIGPDDRFPNGVVFGLKDDTCLQKKEGSIFPEILQDWPRIRKSIRPLIANIMKVTE